MKRQPNFKPFFLLFCMTAMHFLAGCTLSAANSRSGSGAKTADPCPAAIRGEVVRPDGCPNYTHHSMYVVMFPSGSTDVRSSIDVNIMDAAARDLVKTGRTTQWVMAGTDTCQDAEASLKLAQARLDKVLAHLRTKGVRPEQLANVRNRGQTRFLVGGPPRRGVGSPDCASYSDNVVQIVVEAWL